MLNLNGSLTKAGVDYASLWSEIFDDDFFIDGLKQWLSVGKIDHDAHHLRAFDPQSVPADDTAIAMRIAQDLRHNKPILGVFDEGCMGMYNAIIPDELLMPMGVFKERLSQSALYFAIQQIPETDGRVVYDWMLARGMMFHLGTDPAKDLTEVQVIDQCRMYIAAVRMADDFGCEAIGIQYQQGLKDLLPASDLVEGMLNNEDRPQLGARTGLLSGMGKQSCISMK
ncbi:hypothetical protein [Pacificibacter marinus]|uniref:Uncharacterized protein n=1 Tax=Pacificibacter marinus TaxID=658057 RepID=A0A1Y5SDK6_9RHOB|nr:hypothetical protein [Pacificibacter marinus]SEK51851.1 hypothetical protein SAMN04488032_103143 [Pacificibacter marinus]SLN38158.1 hypothetical protein PAM7971_01696 [Pacificibacter marinus]